MGNKQSYEKSKNLLTINDTDIGILVQVTILIIVTMKILNILKLNILNW